MEVTPELLEYLNSVEDLYKTGVPQALLGEGAAQPAQSLQVAWGKPEAKICFVGIDKDWRLDVAGQPFAGPNGELLRALIENGLKLNLQDVRVIGVLHDLPEPGEEQIKALSGKVAELITSGPVIVLGEKTWSGVFDSPETFSEARGKILSKNKLEILPTFALSQVRFDLALKRQFWSDLQVLIGRL